MIDYAIQVENLSKRYRIGKALKPTNGRKMFLNRLASPFQYLVNTLRRPTESETLLALKDISFEVQRGGTVGLIGRNGAGKSTLLKILSRITEPSSGCALIHGRVGSLLEVGTGFHPELTGRENIYMSGAVFGMKRVEIERRFEEIVAFAEVEKFLDTPVKRYSSGMYVRLAFAVAAHLEPEILLVDEVLAVGDAAFQKKCLGKMGEVAKEGRTVLFVSHNMVAMQNLCERVIWLNEGEIMEDGKTNEVVTKYLQVSSSTITEQFWKERDIAPGNDKVRLRRVCVRPADGSPTDLITMETSFTIEIEFWNLTSDACLTVVLHIYTEQEIIAFGTSSIVEPLWRGRPFPTGLFHSVCHVPGNLLNSGLYRVVLLIVKDETTIVYRQDKTVSFEVVEAAKRNSAWHGKSAGVFRPKLKWTIEHVGE